MTHLPTLPFGAPWRVDATDTGEWRWTFSPAVYRLHGIPEGSQPAGLDLLLAGHDPADADLVDRARDALLSHHAFAHRRSLVREDGVVEVLALGMGEYDEDGELVAVSGLFLELQDVVRDAVTAQLAEVVASRSVIEQAKGVLMATYGVDEDEAFDLLGWYSQRTNTKVRTLAARLVDGTTGRPAQVGDVDRHVCTALDPAAVERCGALLQGMPSWSPGAPAPQVTSRVVDGHVVVTLAGDVDVARTPGVVDPLRHTLAAVTRPQRPHVLDLSGLGHLCPTAAQAVVGVVVKHLQRAAALHVVAGPWREPLLGLGIPASCLAG